MAFDWQPQRFNLCFYNHMAFFSCVSVYASVFPSYMDTSHIAFGLTLMTSSWLECIYKKLFSKLMQKSASLCTDAKSNLRHRVLGEVEKDSFITLPGKGVHRGILLRNPMCSSSGEFGEEFHGKGWRVDLLIRVCARFLVVCLLILMSFPSPIS